MRFDGLTFLLVAPRVTPRDSGPTVLGVAAAPDGSVWARLRGPALVRYRHGSFTTVPTGNQASVVTAMVRTRDGSLLLSPLGQGAMVHRAGRLAPIGPPGLARNSLVLSIAETTAGDVWLGTSMRASSPSADRRPRRSRKASRIGRSTACSLARTASSGSERTAA